LKEEVRNRQTNWVVNTGLFTNILLAFSKLIAGSLGASQALLADGVNSVSDIVYYIVIKVFISLAKKPPDVEHPYGHTQLESIAALTVGAFVTVTGITLFIDSLTATIELLTGQVKAEATVFFTLWVGLGAIIVKIFLAIYSLVIARRTKNAAVMAIAQDHRNDVLATAGAVIGIILSKLGFPWVDPLAGAAVSLIISYTGINILRTSSADLMDTVPGRALSQKIIEILKPIEEIKTIEEIHAHRFGPYFIVNITIGLEGSLTVKEGDAVATRVEDTLYRELDYIRRVYVHYHPATPPDKRKKGAGGTDLIL
jgi:cation diffusion facilitator family transporter